jgi:hypothetical protein
MNSRRFVSQASRAPTRIAQQGRTAGYRFGACRFGIVCVEPLPKRVSPNVRSGFERLEEWPQQTADNRLDMIADRISARTSSDPEPSQGRAALSLAMWTAACKSCVLSFRTEEDKNA